MPYKGKNMSCEQRSGDKEGTASWHWSNNPRAKVEFVENPQENDVLFGRGAPFIRWKGNVRFRRLVNQRKGEYVATRRHAEKNAIAREIIDEIQMNRGGRFLIKHEEDGKQESTADSVLWVPADRNLVFEKVKQTLRDKQPGTMVLDEESEVSIEKKRKPVALPERTQRASQTSRGLDPPRIDVLDMQAVETSSDLDANRKSNRPRFDVPSSVIPTRSHHGNREFSSNTDHMNDNRRHGLALLTTSNRSECEEIHHPSPTDQPQYGESGNLGGGLRRQLALRRHIEQQQIRTDLMELELQRRRLELHRYDGLRASPGQEQAMNGAFSRSNHAAWSIPVSSGSSRVTDNLTRLQQDLLQNRFRQFLQRQQPRMTEIPSAPTSASQHDDRSLLNNVRSESSAMELLRWQGNLLQPPRNISQPFQLQNQGGEYVPLESLLRLQRIIGAGPNSSRSVVNSSLPSGFPRNYVAGGEASLWNSSRDKHTGDSQSNRPAQEGEK